MKIKQLMLIFLIVITTVLTGSNLSASTLKPKIQLAILLDSSNSMDGLIDQAKSQLWKIVNHLTKVSKNGEKPVLEIALYHYGNDSLPSSEGHLRQLTRFTPELDLISENLFAIKTNGGQEYAGWVINAATRELEWSSNKNDFRGVFIAGNEPFDQGPVMWNDSIKKANQKNIIINTIYCGNAENEERNLWARAANVGNGSNFNIDQNQVIVNIPTPYDDDINNWNLKLNDTYIPYGIDGLAGQARQAEEDQNALMQGVGGMRSSAKISSYYRNTSWDLIDALDEGVVKLEDIDNNNLPEIMQNMTLDQKYDYVLGKKAEREKIKEIIADLSKKRQAYIDRETINNNPTDTLDYVIIETLNKQLRKKGFIIDN